MVPAWLLTVLLAPLAAQTPVASHLPADGTHTANYARELLALRKRLAQTPEPITDRERSESVEWMLAANPEIHSTLVGHHVVVMATDGFAERATQNDFVLNLDLAYEVLQHVWGVDPCARAGRRFFIWPDPGRDRGHQCNGHDLRISIGRADWNNADWFERFFHEMTHGFQFEHPAGYLGTGGFGEGWAEFMQAVVSDYLAPLGAPFEGRFTWYSGHFPAAAHVEYLQTRLPIEEIIAYDPSAGLWMELVNTTLDAQGNPDWSPLRKLLQDPIEHPRWTPWHLWPARMARDCMSAFGEKQARPILQKFRFPLDRASLDAAQAQNSGAPRPDASPRTPVTGWKSISPKGSTDPGWEPWSAEDMAWRWRELAPHEELPPLPSGTELKWNAAQADERNTIVLADANGTQAFYYLATTLPENLRKPLTLFISSDDDCSVWLDGRLVHQFRGSRACTPDFPDVAYADATSSRGQLVAIVVNHGGAAGFSMSVAEGGLLFQGFEERLKSSDPRERQAAVTYIASRRHPQPVSALLERCAKDFETSVRSAARWYPDHRPKKSGDYREAEEAYAAGSIRGGFFGGNAGSSGNQCVARSWGGDRENWLSLPLEIRESGKQRVRIRYACPNEASLRVRIRRGDRVLFTSEAQRLKPSGKDWSSWSWHEVDTPELERGIDRVELIEPANVPDIDIVGIEKR